MLKAIAKAYRVAAYGLLTILILWMVLNVFAWVALKISHRFFPPPNPVIARYGREFTLELERKIYPDLSHDEVQAMLNEMWGRPVKFDPFTTFRERRFQGKYVNISEHGYRRVRNQGPWPPAASNLNVFFFGGSTTFGYGLPDWQTIPSYVQDILREKFNLGNVCVYNFGTNSFYSSQERAYFQSWITQNQIPDVAVFFDGLNEFFYIDNVPKYSRELAELLDVVVRYKPPPSPWVSYLNDWPFVRLMMETLSPRQTQVYQLTPQDFELTEADIRYFKNEQVLSSVIGTYRRNKQQIEAVAKSVGCAVLFVWQPIPAYKCDLRYHPFGHRGKKMFSVYGYPIMEELHRKGELGDNFLWAADLQEGLTEPLYVDQVHYTSAFAKRIAEFIAPHIAERLLRIDKQSRLPRCMRDGTTSSTLHVDG
ncbi:MAG: SGNH/GDSL hydrolase family protein [Candidatus Sumerlaea chitinivorans]|nr:SGNH/GDSL hydrolase family protein [Candidatus Sumerlaea chitinivorans]